MAKNMRNQLLETIRADGKLFKANLGCEAVAKRLGYLCQASFGAELIEELSSISGKNISSEDLLKLKLKADYPTNNATKILKAARFFAIAYNYYFSRKVEGGTQTDEGQLSLSQAMEGQLKALFGNDITGMVDIITDYFKKREHGIKELLHVSAEKIEVPERHVKQPQNTALGEELAPTQMHAGYLSLKIELDEVTEQLSAYKPAKRRFWKRGTEGHPATLSLAPAAKGVMNAARQKPVPPKTVLARGLVVGGTVLAAGKRVVDGIQSWQRAMQGAVTPPVAPPAAAATPVSPPSAGEGTKGPAVAGAVTPQSPKSAVMSIMDVVEYIADQSQRNFYGKVNNPIGPYPALINGYASIQSQTLVHELVGKIKIRAPNVNKLIIWADIEWFTDRVAAQSLGNDIQKNANARHDAAVISAYALAPDGVVTDENRVAVGALCNVAKHMVIGHEMVIKEGRLQLEKVEAAQPAMTEATTPTPAVEKPPAVSPPPVGEPKPAEPKTATTEGNPPSSQEPVAQRAKEWWAGILTEKDIQGGEGLDPWGQLSGNNKIIRVANRLVAILESEYAEDADERENGQKLVTLLKSLSDKIGEHAIRKKELPQDTKDKIAASLKQAVTEWRQSVMTECNAKVGEKSEAGALQLTAKLASAVLVVIMKQDNSDVILKEVKIAAELNKAVIERYNELKGASGSSGVNQLTADYLLEVNCAISGQKASDSETGVGLELVGVGEFMSKQERARTAAAPAPSEPPNDPPAESGSVPDPVKTEAKTEQPQEEQTPKETPKPEEGEAGMALEDTSRVTPVDATVESGTSPSADNTPETVVTGATPPQPSTEGEKINGTPPAEGGVAVVQIVHGRKVIDVAKEEIASLIEQRRRTDAIIAAAKEEFGVDIDISDATRIATALALVDTRYKALGALEGASTRASLSPIPASDMLKDLICKVKDGNWKEEEGDEVRTCVETAVQAITNRSLLCRLRRIPVPEENKDLLKSSAGLICLLSGEYQKLFGGNKLFAERALNGVKTQPPEAFTMPVQTSDSVYGAFKKIEDRIKANTDEGYYKPSNAVIIAITLAESNDMTAREKAEVILRGMIAGNQKDYFIAANLLAKVAEMRKVIFKNIGNKRADNIRDASLIMALDIMFDMDDGDGKVEFSRLNIERRVEAFLEARSGLYSNISAARASMAVALAVRDLPEVIQSVNHLNSAVSVALNADKKTSSKAKIRRLARTLYDKVSPEHLNTALALLRLQGHDLHADVVENDVEAYSREVMFIGFNRPSFDIGIIPSLPTAEDAVDMRDERLIRAEKLLGVLNMEAPEDRENGLNLIITAEARIARELVEIISGQPIEDISLKVVREALIKHDRFLEFWILATSRLSIALTKEQDNDSNLREKLCGSNGYGHRLMVALADEQVTAYNKMLILNNFLSNLAPAGMIALTLAMRGSLASREAGEALCNLREVILAHSNRPSGVNGGLNRLDPCMLQFLNFMELAGMFNKLDGRPTLMEASIISVKPISGTLTPTKETKMDGETETVGVAFPVQGIGMGSPPGLRRVVSRETSKVHAGSQNVSSLPEENELGFLSEVMTEMAVGDVASLQRMLNSDDSQMRKLIKSILSAVVYGIIPENAALANLADDIKDRENAGMFLTAAIQALDLRLSNNGEEEKVMTNLKEQSYIADVRKLLMAVDAGAKNLMTCLLGLSDVGITMLATKICESSNGETDDRHKETLLKLTESATVLLKKNKKDCGYVVFYRAMMIAAGRGSELGNTIVGDPQVRRVAPLARGHDASASLA